MHIVSSARQETLQSALVKWFAKIETRWVHHVGEGTIVLNYASLEKSSWQRRMSDGLPTFTYCLEIPEAR